MKSMKDVFGRRKIVLGLMILFSVILLWAESDTVAQEIKRPAGYPHRPIEVVVPYGPGGGADMTARGICEPASKILGDSMVYRYMPGGLTAVGLSYFLEQPADGRTIFEATASDVVLSELYGRTKYGVNDFDFLMSAVFEQQAIHTRYDSKWKSIQQVIDYVKSHPSEKFTISGADKGGIDDIFVTLINKGSGIKGGIFKFIPFASSGERHASFLGEHTTFLSDEIGDVAGKGFYKNNRIRTILISGDTRVTKVPLLKDVPTTTEMGFKVASFIGNWRIFAVKKGTPPEVLKYLQAVFKAAYDSPSWQGTLEKEYRNLRDEESYFNGEQCKERAKAEKILYTQVLKEEGYIK